MKVRELRELLAGVADDDEVVLSKDAEGNGYSPLAGGWSAIYVPDSTWSGDVYMRELSAEDREQGYTEEDLYDGADGQLAFVLSPTN
jgi:hypothetical protein